MITLKFYRYVPVNSLTGIDTSYMELCQRSHKQDVYITCIQYKKVLSNTSVIESNLENNLINEFLDNHFGSVESKEDDKEVKHTNNLSYYFQTFLEDGVLIQLVE